MKKKLILASTSPRRKNILKNLRLNFEIIPSEYEEKLENTEFEYKKIELLAYNKGKSVQEIIKEPALILSADTVVVSNDKILGKPKDTKDAYKMLQELSGKTHSVVTAVCLIDTEKDVNYIISKTSFVTFTKISNGTITKYIEEFKPFDKAGAYGIQELPKEFGAKVDGSFENVVGLCSKSVEKIFQQAKLNLDEFKQT